MTGFWNEKSIFKVLKKNKQALLPTQYRNGILTLRRKTGNEENSDMAHNFAWAMILFILAGCGSKVLMTNAFSIEDEAVSTVEIETQGNLTLDVLDGDIKVTFWQEDYLEITEKRTVRGPAKKEKLKELLEKNKYFVESTEYSISVSKPQDPDKKDAKEGKSIISITK